MNESNGGVLVKVVQESEFYRMKSKIEMFSVNLFKKRLKTVPSQAYKPIRDNHNTPFFLLLAKLNNYATKYENFPFIFCSLAKI